MRPQCTSIGYCPRKDRALGRPLSLGPVAGSMFHASPACHRSPGSITSTSTARNAFRSETKRKKFPSPCCASVWRLNFYRPFDELLCGCQVANAQMLLCFFFLLLNQTIPDQRETCCYAWHGTRPSH